MSGKKLFHRNQRVQLKIVDLAFEGKGIAKVETEAGALVVFVPNTLPGQEVEARIIKAKKTYAEAKLVRILKASPDETDLGYHPIAGAPYINLPIDKQRYYKEKTSLELFRRIGKVVDVEQRFDEYLESPRIFHYRNKMEYSFSAVIVDEESQKLIDGFGLGFKKRGQWLAVENLSGDSGMFDPAFEALLPKIRDFFIKHELPAYHIKQHRGFGRLLAVRKSFSEDKLLVNFLSSSQDLSRFPKKEFAALFTDALGERLAGLIHTVNDDISDRPKATEGNQELLLGKDYLTENILGLNFKIRMESFFQTNPASAEILYRKALNYVFEAQVDQKPVVMDLFSGTGTISQLLAQDAPNTEVVGVEIVPEAVQDARKSAGQNGLSNLKFFAADVGRFLLDHPEYQNRIHTIVLDPPRAGIAPKTLRKIIRLGAERIVYISCNPATQARDIEILNEHRYALKKFSLVDQFPHTAHIESVALFERINL